MSAVCGRAKRAEVTTSSIPRSSTEPGGGVATDPNWVSASGHFYTGVRLYFGPNRMEVGEVLGGNDRYVDPITGRTIRGVKIRMSSGGVEWKDRNAIISNDQWQVRSDDPAIARAEWFEYTR